MKKLIAFLSVACVSLASCSETLDEDSLNKIMKKFDFSEVDTDNLQGIREETNFSTSDLTVFTGTIDDCAWIGVFDSQSGSLQCQYTDKDHPTSYYAGYGEECKYDVGVLSGFYFEKNKAVLVFKYPDSQYHNYRLDLVVTDGNTDYRFIIDEKGNISTNPTSIVKWADSAICIVVGENSGRESPINIIYDLDNNKILCRVDEMLGFYNMIHDEKFYFMISHTDILHFWNPNFMALPTFYITEVQCTYDAIYFVSNKEVELFDPYIGNHAPRYSFESRINTNDHILAIVTQTEYDGTVTKKTVDIRLVNDELKVDIQE